jgi:hypothetical protein
MTPTVKRRASSKRQPRKTINGPERWFSALRDRERGETYRVIGERYGVSAERIRQNVAKASRIRSQRQAKGLPQHPCDCAP